MSTRKLQVEILGDARGVSKAFGEAEKSGSKWERAMARTRGGLRKLGKVAAGAGLALGAGLAAATAVGVKGLMEDEKALTKVRSTLDSTSGVAKVTEKDITSLANAMQAKTGVGADEIMTNQSLLLTFTNIRNEVGKGNDVFDQATKLSLDMAKAMGTDMKGASIQMGKALNDPIRGMSAMTKSGVSFTEQQVEQVRALQESGDMLGAQKIILGEVETQFGGTADALGQTVAGQMERGKRAFEEVTKVLAGALMPILADFGEWLLSTGLPAVHRFTARASALMERWGPTIRKAFGVALDVIRAAIKWIAANVVPAVRNMADGVRRVVDRLVVFWNRFGDDIVRVVQAAFVVVSGVVRTAMEVVRNVVTAVMAIIEGDWGKAWDAIKAALGAALSGIAVAIRDTLVALVPAVIKLAWNVGTAIISHIGKGFVSMGLGALAYLRKETVDKVTALFRAAERAAAGLAGKIAAGITGAALGVAGWLRAQVYDRITGLFAEARAAAGRLAGQVASGVTGTALGVGGWLRAQVYDRITGALGSTFTAAKTLAGRVVSGVTGTVIPVGTWLKEQVLDKVTAQLANVKDRAAGLGRGFMAGFRDTIIEFTKLPVNGFIRVINRILGALRKIPIIGGKIPAAIPELANGDIVNRATMAVVGEDGPEAVIPLGRKRRRRGAELLRQAASIMGMPGDFSGPTRVNRGGPIPMLAEGGIFAPQVSGWADAQAYMMAAPSGEGLLTRVRNFAARGLATLIDTLPDIPDTLIEPLGGLARGVRETIVAGLRELGKRKDTWDPGKIVDALKWAASQMGKPYVWGGGHGPWDWNLRGYDCSGFTSHAAKKAGANLGAPGTTMSLHPMGRAGKSDDRMTFGFRGMHSSNPREQHMGIRILGRWFQFGNPGREGGGDGQWNSFRTIDGMPGYFRGTPYVPRTGPALLHRGEAVVPANDAARMRRDPRSGGGPLVHIEHMTVQDAGDVDRLAAQLDRRVAMAVAG